MILNCRCYSWEDLFFQPTGDRWVVTGQKTIINLLFPHAVNCFQALFINNDNQSLVLKNDQLMVLQPITG